MGCKRRDTGFSCYFLANLGEHSGQFLLLFHVIPSQYLRSAASVLPPPAPPFPLQQGTRYEGPLAGSRGLPSHSFDIEERPPSAAVTDTHSPQGLQSQRCSHSCNLSMRCQQGALLLLVLTQGPRLREAPCSTMVVAEKGEVGDTW